MGNFFDIETQPEDIPVQESPDTAVSVLSAAEIEQQRQAELDRAEKSKRDIVWMIENGQPPQYILAKAIDCVGIYASDPDWTKTAQKLLQQQYADIPAQTLLAEKTAQSMQDLAELANRHTAKLRRQLNNMASTYQQIQQKILIAREHLDNLETTQAMEKLAQ